MVRTQGVRETLWAESSPFWVCFVKLLRLDRIIAVYTLVHVTVAGAWTGSQAPIA
jgi:hypothetical protein